MTSTLSGKVAMLSVNNLRRVIRTFPKFLVVHLLISTWLTVVVSLEYAMQQAGLTAVPYIQTSYNWDIINVDYNAITRIICDDFQGHLSVQSISLISNDIYFIDDAAFSTNLALELLFLQNNDVIILPTDGINPVQMNYISMGGQGPSVYFPDDYFLKHRKLESLQIPDCGIKVAPSFGDMPELTRLNMQNNPIETVPDLSGLPNLSILLIDVDSIFCDIRHCWGLFEPFDFSERQPYISLFTGNTYEISNELDFGTLQCANPPERRGLLFIDITPLGLQCYNGEFL